MPAPTVSLKPFVILYRVRLFPAGIKILRAGGLRPLNCAGIKIETCSRSLGDGRKGGFSVLIGRRHGHQFIPLKYNTGFSVRMLDIRSCKQAVYSSLQRTVALGIAIAVVSIVFSSV